MALAWTAALSMVLLAAGDSPRVAWVIVESANVQVEPADSAYSTGQLTRGDKVTVRRDGPDGWVTIAPPEGSFSYIEESDLEDMGDGRAQILTKYAAVRPGREGVRMPGPARVTLKQGTVVRLLEQRPLVVRDGTTVQTWIPIAPPKLEVRFLRSDSVGEVQEPQDAAEKSPKLSRLASDRTPAQPAEIPQMELGAIDPAFFTTKPIGAEAGVSPQLLDAMSKIASRHQTELRKPIDQWNLKPIESAYLALQKTAIDDADRRAIDHRLAIVLHQNNAGVSATRIATLLQKSRLRDRGVSQSKKGVTEGAPEIEGDYDVGGLLQTSSKMVNGRRVYVLLNDDGKVIAYLSVPPGLEIRSFVSHRVGIRGEGGFDESLKMRLVLVRDIELLDDIPRTLRMVSPLKP